MTAITVDRRSGVLLLGMAAVASLTVRHRMHTGQREAAGSVKFQDIAAILPVARRVTVLAIGTELAVMVIGVAVGATYPDM